MAKKLLLADDSVTIQKVVGISFANEDIEILTVDNGDDALASAREHRPDVILADVVMPGKNGYEVCEALKADPALAHVPVLLLTGTFEAFDEERAEQAQANGHITKPFEAQALVDRVNELLARAPQPAAAPAPCPPLPAAAESVVTSATPQPPAVESASDDDGFDFFDDALETDSGDADLPTGAREPATTAFEIDAGESAFDFAPVVEAPTPEAVPAPDTTTLVAPPEHAVGAADATMALGVEPRGDDWPTSDQLDAAFDEDSFSRPRESAPLPDPAAHAAPGEQPTVLDLEGALAEPAGDLELDTVGGADDDLFGAFEGPDASRQAVQDPDEGQDFAVSSSDLGDPLGLGPELATPARVEPATEPPSPEPEPEPAFDAPTPEPVFGIPIPEPAFEAPAAEPAFDAATPQPVLEAPGTEPGFDLGEPNRAVAAFGAQEDEFPPLEPTHEAFEPAPVAGAPEPEPMAFEAPPDPTPVAVAASPGPDISGVMRDRIHDSLEKIAWEAFAELPEQLIREALAKFEEIAWEVIPQMAEALIREEIRRMKGDPE
jgi:CheY-like chemotaxis protein